MASQHRNPLTPEKPLAPAGVFRLTVLAAGVLALFYVGCLAALLFTVALLALDLGLAVGATRFGIGGFMKGPLEALLRLLSCLTRSLRLEREADYALPLRAEQAPGLFALVDRVARASGVRTPDRVVLEMSDNAWVRLRGYRRGRGHCTLGLGYDLLAILTEEELAAVLAHEMAHARLVGRGLKGWLGNGVARAARMADALREEARPGPERGRFFLAEILANAAARLAGAGARHFAALCRQDEFDADRAAAALCGSAVGARALRRSHVSGLKAGPHWRDRLVASQRGVSLAAWVRELRLPADEAERQALEALALGEAPSGEFRAHPSLADRLAALQSVASQSVAPPPAAGDDRPDASLPAQALLGDADALAADLIAHVERVAAEEERLAGRRLRRLARKDRKPRTRHTAGEAAGMALTAVGATLAFLGLLGLGIALWLPSSPGQAAKDAASSLTFVGPGVLMLAAGGALMRLLRFKDRIALPVPPLALFMASLEARDLSAPAQAAQTCARQEAERALRAQAPPALKRRPERARFWAHRAYDSLAQCDYVRAEAASALCLEADPRSVEGRAARGVTSAYFGDAPGFAGSLGVAVREYGATRSLSWGLGWSLLMLGEWPRAEASLQDAIESAPETAALRPLCGLCRWQQGKTREAAGAVRQAIALAPPEPAHRLLLARILLASGLPRDAAREFDLLEADLPRDPDLMAGRVRAALLLGDGEEADCRAASFEAAHPSAKTLLRLADLYAGAGREDAAEGFRGRVQAQGFYPEASIGLARAAHRRGEDGAARALLLSALDMTRAPGPHALGPLDVLADILRGLLVLNPPPCACSEWAAAIPLPSPAPGMRCLSLRVAAPSPAEAAALVGEVYAAMRPGADLSGTEIEWRPLPASPEGGDVRPGVTGWQFS